MLQYFIDDFIDEDAVVFVFIVFFVSFDQSK